MADENTPAPGPDETATVSEAPTSQGEEGLGDGGKKALEAERREKRAAQKELTELQKRLQAFEDRDKSEAQKLAEAKAAAEKDAADARQELMRYRIAADKKLPASLAVRLRGSTEEEMAADADALLEVLGAQQQANSPSYDGGVRKPAPAPTDMNSLIRQKAGLG
ncbi:hypothetical protein [Streptomyces resistomycificus]|uniref:hypothetical protein n=1 Tax=Streptomyces resistomycificus TaxID=67356 RepID=UPI00068BB011|nr:hypothetical protein [Streptomyces resistomycificus]KUN99494.1 hypothetical protein AQJ84_11135 [Streptomyces resistomycificus]